MVTSYTYGGITYYVHTAFATSTDGTENFTVTEPTDYSYIGTVTNTTSTEITDAGEYEWNPIAEDETESYDFQNEAIENRLQSLENTVSNLLMVETISISQTVSASGYLESTVSASKTGYTPLGVVGIRYSGTGSTNAHPMRHYVDDAEQLTVLTRNGTTSAITVTAYADILYVKN